jgi:hypothetical protein
MRRVLIVGIGVLCLHLCQPAVWAENKEAVNKAVEHGVAHLRKLQKPDGTWPHEQIGATALAGLTLIECGAADDDPAIRKALDAVRKACPGLTHTYSLALAVLFFDRVGLKEDVPHIESLSVRLMAGQIQTAAGLVGRAKETVGYRSRRGVTCLRCVLVRQEHVALASGTRITAPSTPGCGWLPSGRRRC